MKNRKYLIIIIALASLVTVVLIQIFIRVNRQQEQDEPVSIELINKEGENEQKAEAYQVSLVKQNPLIANLPYYSDSFEIYYGIKDKESYSVSYKIILIPQSSLDNAETYQNELNLLKNRAFDWVRSKGVDPNNLEIEWTTK